MSGCTTLLSSAAFKVANEMHIAQPDKVATKLRYEALLRYESPSMKLQVRRMSVIGGGHKGTRQTRQVLRGGRVSVVKGFILSGWLGPHPAGRARLTNLPK